MSSNPLKELEDVKRRYPDAEIVIGSPNPWGKGNGDISSYLVLTMPLLKGKFNKNETTLIIHLGNHYDYGQPPDYFFTDADLKLASGMWLNRTTPYREPVLGRKVCIWEGQIRDWRSYGGTPMALYNAVCVARLALQYGFTGNRGGDSWS